ncbi:MAG: hypothetical protein M2R45_03111 [Verrucomicrobia subdivision 3 bacterium]|nr:hypothetical protein [Limisphaerales bacterium]MCS1413179.1 hypothetical protein [Limisphaerales bacterium]
MEGNQQLRVTGIRWGLAGWVYAVSGGHPLVWRSEQSSSVGLRFVGPRLWRNLNVACCRILGNSFARYVTCVCTMSKPVQKRYHSFEQSSRFTSACGPSIYRDTLSFAKEPGVAYAFKCEPFHNIVQHHVLTGDGVSFNGRRAKEAGDKDFLRWRSVGGVRS